LHGDDSDNAKYYPEGEGFRLLITIPAVFPAFGCPAVKGSRRSQSLLSKARQS
jgi:hypothetical protein